MGVKERLKLLLGLCVNAADIITALKHLSTSCGLHDGFMTPPPTALLCWGLSAKPIEECTKIVERRLQDSFFTTWRRQGTQDTWRTCSQTSLVDVETEVSQEYVSWESVSYLGHTLSI